MSSPVVLITGALTGIGRATAVVFAHEGARVVVSGRHDKEGQKLVAELQGLGAEAVFVRTDVRKDEEDRTLSTKWSCVSDAWILPSIMPDRGQSRPRRRKPPRAITAHSTSMCLGCF